MTNESNKEFVKDCFFKALIELMKTTPYKDITIKDICEKAGYSRMAYYRNFEDKDDIIKYKVRTTNEMLKNAMRKDPNDNTAFKKIYDEYLNNKLITNLFKARLLEYYVLQNRDLIIFFFDEIYHYDMSKDETKVKIYDALGITISTMLYLINENKIYSFKEVVDKINSFVI